MRFAFVAAYREGFLLNFLLPIFELCGCLFVGTSSSQPVTRALPARSPASTKEALVGEMKLVAGQWSSDFVHQRGPPSAWLIFMICSP